MASTLLLYSRTTKLGKNVAAAKDAVKEICLAVYTGYCRLCYIELYSADQSFHEFGGLSYVEISPVTPAPSGCDVSSGPYCMCLPIACSRPGPPEHDFRGLFRGMGHPLLPLQHCRFAEEWRCRSADAPYPKLWAMSRPLRHRHAPLPIRRLLIRIMARRSRSEDSRPFLNSLLAEASDKQSVAL